MSDLLIGLDIGGTKSAAVVGTIQGEILARVSASTPTNTDADPFQFITHLIRSVCDEFGCQIQEARALGVSYGGPWSSSTGITLPNPNLPAWTGLPLRSLLLTEFQIPVNVENDANATALAEHRWGAGQGTSDMAFLTMGTGIGAGLILDGQLYRGRRDLAGEIGHVMVWPDGPLCRCGKHGCLETLASGTAIGRIGSERFDEPNMTSIEVCARARAGDALALEILDDASRWMGIGLSHLLQTLNLERIVLGTLAIHAGDLLLDPIRRYTQQYCWPQVWDGVQILPAALGDSAQDKAALAVAMLSIPISD